MFFIHTFSMIKLFDRNEDVIGLSETYNNHVIREGDGRCIIIRFAEQGVRICLRYLEPERVKYEKKAVEAEIIITPYKLLNNGKAMGRLRELEEYGKALLKYYEIIADIKKESGVELSDAVMERIDVTKDVVTPSDIYTKEIIAALKVKRLPYGFHPMEKRIVIENKWNPDNAYCYRKNTDKHDVSVKVYDKIQNLRDYKCADSDFIGERGLLRFEISLNSIGSSNRKYRKESAVESLWCALKDARKLFEEYVVDPLNFGEMLSGDVLFKYIDRKIQKPARNEKMCSMVEACRRNKKYGDMMRRSEMGSEKKTDKTLEYFEKLGLSPVPLAADCPYVPSVEKMIFGSEDTESYFFAYARKHTREKQYWRYDDYEL